MGMKEAKQKRRKRKKEIERLVEGGTRRI